MAEESTRKGNKRAPLYGKLLERQALHQSSDFDERHRDSRKDRDRDRRNSNERRSRSRESDLQARMSAAPAKDNKTASERLRAFGSRSKDDLDSTDERRRKKPKTASNPALRTSDDQYPIFLGGRHAEKRHVGEARGRSFSVTDSDNVVDKVHNKRTNVNDIVSTSNSRKRNPVVEGNRSSIVTGRLESRKRSGAAADNDESIEEQRGEVDFEASTEMSEVAEDSGDNIFRNIDGGHFSDSDESEVVPTIAGGYWSDEEDTVDAHQPDDVSKDGSVNGSDREDAEAFSGSAYFQEAPPTDSDEDVGSINSSSGFSKDERLRDVEEASVLSDVTEQEVLEYVDEVFDPSSDEEAARARRRQKRKADAKAKAQHTAIEVDLPPAEAYGVQSDAHRLKSWERAMTHLSTKTDRLDVAELRPYLTEEQFDVWRNERNVKQAALNKCLRKLVPLDGEVTSKQMASRELALARRSELIKELMQLYDLYRDTAKKERSRRRHEKKTEREAARDRKAAAADALQHERRLAAIDIAASWTAKEKVKHLKHFRESGDSRKCLFKGDLNWKNFIAHYDKWKDFNATQKACLYQSRFSEKDKEFILAKAAHSFQIRTKPTERGIKSYDKLRELLYQEKDFSMVANRRLLDILTVNVFPAPERMTQGKKPLLEHALSQLGTKAKPWRISWFSEQEVQASREPLRVLKHVEYQKEWADMALAPTELKAANLSGVKALNKVIEKGDVGLEATSRQSLLTHVRDTRPRAFTINQWTERFDDWLFQKQDQVEAVRAEGAIVLPRSTKEASQASTNTKDKKHKEGPPGQKTTTAGSRRDRGHHDSQEESCEGCGKTGHTRDECILKDHPNWNKQVGVSWKDSKAGQHWASRPRNPDGKIVPLSFKYLWDGSIWPGSPKNPGGPAKEQKSPAGKTASGNKRQSSGGQSGGQTGIDKKFKGKPVVVTRIFAVTRDSVGGPTTPCLLLHPTLPYTKPIHPFLDSMSRETVMSESLAHHLAVEGLVGKPPPELAKEKVEFELADGSVVKPVDRATIILYSKVTQRSYELHPFVIENAQEWLLIGGVDIVAMDLTGVLGASLRASYSIINSNILERFPPQHSDTVTRDTEVERGKEMLTVDREIGTIPQGGRKRRRDGNQSTSPDSPSNLVVEQASGVLTNQKRGASKPEGDQPVLHVRVGASPMSARRLSLSATTSGSTRQRDANGEERTERRARKTDESECVIEYRRPRPDTPPHASGGISDTRANQLCFTVFSSPMEQPEGTTAHMTDFFGPIDDTGDPEEFGREPFDDLEFTAPSESLTALVTINRTNREEAKQIEDLLQEFEDVFAVEVRPEPALVAPIELKVDIEKWKRLGAKGPPRPTNTEKQQATVEMITDMQRLRVVRPSQAIPYSHWHLVNKPSADKTIAQPKSSGSSDTVEVVTKKGFRPTVDFRIFNSCLDSMGWPLPRIKDVFVRIGQKKPKYFAVMDLTSGYHQIPVAVDSIPFTAFVCFMGVYEWLRLPMGIKPAGSFFQQTMQMIFATLLYRIIEIYLDDLIVHAPNFTQYVSNLREVFEAARAKRLTFNPKKCKFLEPEVKALGLTLNSQGIRMSSDKIKKALDFPVPVQTKHLKSFVGLANYFRDFIPLYTQVVTPFNRMLRDYKANRNKKLHWTDDLMSQYQELQQALNDCQQLYFLDDFSPIYLMTDASDYGYGAYLCQIVDGKEHPIAFNSKSFNEVQGRWSTVEQECFAIYSALMEWRCLLEGRKFTIRTDHANLRYMQESPSDKVNRWKLGYQHFDATIEHFRGSFNRIADGFSRLVKDARIERGVPDNMRVAHLCMCLAISDQPRRSKLTSIIRRNIGEIPPEKRTLIAAVHNPIAGHLGIKRTRAALTAQKHSWKGMNTHIRQFIRECPYCQKTSTKLPEVQTTPYTVSSRQPMTVRAVDTLGPFPADDEGYTHVVSIIDMFSRFLCLYPVKDTTAVECVERALLPHFGIFGTPLYLISDNGQQFVADLVKSFHELVGTIQVPITPYSHEENSLVERSHGETLKHVRALVYDRLHHKDWRKLLPLVQRIINAQDLPAIGCTPTDMLFGKTIDTNQGIFLEFSKVEQEQLQVGEYLNKLYREQSLLIKKAQELLHAHQLEHQRKAGAVSEFPVNSYVLVQYPPGPGRRSQPPTKLHTHLKGPLKVVKHEGSDYWLQDIVTGKTRKLPLHASRLVPFRYNPTHTSPLDVARRDLQEFYVHEILQHRYTGQKDRKQRGNLEFLVSWMGYGPEWNSWEPWSNLRAVKALHRYLARVGLSNLIPTEFRRDNYDVESSDSDGDVLGDAH